MSKRITHDEEGHAHFVTYSCYHRRRILDDDEAKQIVLDTLQAQLVRCSGHCAGFVIMPDHVHVVLWFSQPNQLSALMKQWKRTSSRRIAQHFARKLTSYGEWVQGSPVWQAHYYSFNIIVADKLREKVTYMHHNPVRAGLVSQAVDWVWSSAGFYERGSSSKLPIEWIV